MYSKVSQCRDDVNGRVGANDLHDGNTLKCEPYVIAGYCRSLALIARTAESRNLVGSKSEVLVFGD